MAEVSLQEYQLRALESQYMEDLRLKNRTIADLRTELQLARQQATNHTHADDGEVVPLAELDEDVPSEDDE